MDRPLKKMNRGKNIIPLVTVTKTPITHQFTNRPDPDLRKLNIDGTQKVHGSGQPEIRSTGDSFHGCFIRTCAVKIGQKSGKSWFYQPLLALHPDDYRSFIMSAMEVFRGNSRVYNKLVMVVRSILIVPRLGDPPRNLMFPGKYRPSGVPHFMDVELNHTLS